jgi:phospholipid-binding lipoprotein MlaA
MLAPRYGSTALLAALLIFAWPTARAGTDRAVTKPTPGDPWERGNRVGYAVEGGLDKHLIHPLAKIYHTLTPGPIGRGVHNILVNLSEPVAFFNDVLQLRLKRAGIAGARFITNSTVGILGLFDVAARAGMTHQDNEFGVTLGRYGVHPGPYMYLPLLGPTTVRDLLGSGLDFVIDPVHWLSYPDRTQVGVARFVVSGLDTRIMTEDQLNALLSGAVDPYATLRSVYLQNKQGEIEGGGVPLNLPSFDDAVPAQPPAAPPSPDDTKGMNGPSTHDTMPVDVEFAAPPSNTRDKEAPAPDPTSQ